MGPEGTLVAFTQARAPSPVHPVEQPIYGLILLSGAGTALLHLIGGSPLGNLKTGMKLTPVFREERKGSILDIEYFRPAP